MFFDISLAVDSKLFANKEAAAGELMQVKEPHFFLLHMTFVECLLLIFLEYECMYRSKILTQLKHLHNPGQKKINLFALENFIQPS